MNKCVTCKFNITYAGVHPSCKYKQCHKCYMNNHYQKRKKKDPVSVCFVSVKGQLRREAIYF